MIPAKRKLRADELLIRNGLVNSKENARALILAGDVFYSKGRIEKPGQFLPSDIEIWMKPKRKFVSRGGEKMEGALKDFALDVAGVKFLDIGASTGGFTDCLLQHGASQSYALDVGRAQMAEKLRRDPRVWFREGVNVRYPFNIEEEVDLIVADVSFISLKLVLLTSLEHLKLDGKILSLVKPQFEASKGQVGNRGIIKDPKVHAQVLGEFCLWAIEQGLKIEGLSPSKIKGGNGNQEFFALFRKI